MQRKIIVLIISVLFLSTSIQLTLKTNLVAQETIHTDPPTFFYLSEDTITYFQVPKNADLTITYQHVWAYGNATFTLFDDSGQFYDERHFTYEETMISKKIHFRKEGTYKMVATGVHFRYQLSFSGPAYEYKCVAAAMPHNPVFRVKNDETTSAYIPVSTTHVSFHIANEYANPARDVTIRIYDETENLQETVYIDSTDFEATYEHITSFHRDQQHQVFWRVEIEGHGTGQSRVVIWTNQSHLDLPTGHCTLVTPAPSYFFIPSFQPRSTSISYTSGNQYACVGSTGNIAGESTYTDIYHQYVSDLNLSVSKHWISWRWRERQGSTAMNDDQDPFHINWEGFDMDAFDERMQYYQHYHIKPILCLQWKQDAFLSKHPADWNQNDINEFAEFCLALAIHSVAPDLEEPSVDHDPYEILGIMPFNEPNLIYNEQLDLEASVDAYIEVLKTVGLRFRSHPDPRINQLHFVVPGVTMGLYSTTELSYWVTQVITHAAEFADIIVWDQYSRFLLEELSGYEEDVVMVQNILEDANLNLSFGLSEFGIHGGIPTSQEFYGSTFAKLYVFGALANSINNDMKYPVYFTLIDPVHEPRQKGLFTGVTSFPPFSDLPPFSPKPQYYAVQITGWICNGSILNISSDISQFDILGSQQDERFRFGFSNRYEAPTTVHLEINPDVTINIYEVTDTGLQFIESRISTGLLTVTLPAWSLYYIETGGEPAKPQADLNGEGYLSWNKVKAKDAVTGSITITNNGDTHTILDWEITEHPNWGTWTFTPANGTNLTPEQGRINVTVTCIAPNEKNKDYNSYVKIINVNNPSDFSVISVTLSTSKSKSIQLINDLRMINPFFYWFIYQVFNFLT